MRITCPNCTAHFDVPVEMLVKKGHSLQCASCGHSWYQTAEIETLDLADIMGKEYAKRTPVEMGGGAPMPPAQVAQQAAQRRQAQISGAQAMQAAAPSGAPALRQAPPGAAPGRAPPQAQSFYQN